MAKDTVLESNFWASNPGFTHYLTLAKLSLLCCSFSSSVKWYNNIHHMVVRIA
jgi:hypothetical protein